MRKYYGQEKFCVETKYFGVEICVVKNVFLEDPSFWKILSFCELWWRGGVGLGGVHIFETFKKASFAKNR